MKLKQALARSRYSHSAVSLMLMSVFVFASIISAVYTYTRLSTPARAYAATSSTLNFQGRLFNNSGSTVPDGNYYIEFNLYTAESGGTSIWRERYQGSAYACDFGTATGNPNNKVNVKNGYFSINLGNLCNFPSTINWDQEHWLSMNVGGSGGAPSYDGEMSPRLKLTAVPYAFRSALAGALTNGSGSLTAADFLQKAPTSPQSVSSSTAGLRFDQTGSGGLIQLRGDGVDVFTVDKTGTGYVKGSFDIDAGLTAGAGNAFSVNANGDITSVFSALNGTSTANGASVLASTSLILVDATNFDVGNYVQVNSANCGGTGINPCYAKITAKSTNTLTITPALTWASGATVNEYHIPELGGTNTGQTLANRYGRGYFIAGVATGNGTTFYNENSIESSLTSFNLLNTNVTTLNIGGASTALSIGGVGTTVTVQGSLQTAASQTITAGGGLVVNSGGAIITGGIDNNIGGITEAGALSGVTTLSASGLISANGGLTIEATDALTIAGDALTDLTGNGLSTNAGALQINQDYSFTWTASQTWNLNDSEVVAVNSTVTGISSSKAQSISIANSTSSGTQSGLYIDNTANSGVTDALLVLDNSDPDTVVTSAFQIVDGGGGFTNLFDIAGTLLSVSEFTVLDGGITLGSESTGDYVQNLGTLTGLTIAGVNSGEGSTPGLSITYGSGANTAVQGNTGLTCPSGTGDLSGGGTAITLGSGGACGNIVISESPVFDTSVTSPTFKNAGGLLTLETTLSAGADDLVFITAGTEKLRLLEDGKLVFGTGANSANLYLSANDTLRTDDALVVGSGLTILGSGVNNNSGNITNAGSISGVGTNITGAGALTVASGGGSALALDSASNILQIAASDTTLQRNAAGTYKIDLLNSAAATTLSIENTDATQVANLSVEGDVNVATGKTYQVGGTQISSANLSNDSNIAKLNGTGPQTFTGNNRFNGTFLQQNASNSTTAFQVQNALATNVVFNVDTQNGRIGIGTNAPSTALDVNGALTVRGMTAPTLSPAGQGRIYFDSVKNRFQSSENGGPYLDLTGFEYLGGSELLSAANTTGAVTVPARDMILIIGRIPSMANPGDIPALRFNGDAGNNYWDRHMKSISGAALFTNTQNASQTFMRVGFDQQTGSRTFMILVPNRAGTSKRASNLSALATNSAATVGEITFGGGEWVNTVNQITTIEMLTVSGRTMSIESGFGVFGKNY